jgi:hypothetical protein
VKYNDDVVAHAHAGEPDGFAEAILGLSPKGSQRQRWLAAFIESPDGFRPCVARARAKGQHPERLLDWLVKEGEHREPSKVTPLDVSPLDRATRYVNASGWQLTDSDLAELLGHQFGIEGREKNDLLDLARTVRARRTQEEAA